MLFQSHCNQDDTLASPKFACILSNVRISQTSQAALRGPFLFVMPNFIEEATLYLFFGKQTPLYCLFEWENLLS